MKHLDNNTTPPNVLLEDEKLIIFGWIETILGFPKDADPTKYNELTDKIYDLILDGKIEEANWWEYNIIPAVRNEQVEHDVTNRLATLEKLRKA
jgi:hypothetical protein